MAKKPFKWNFMERCEGELEKLIDKRSAPEFIEGVQCAYDHKLEEAQNLFEKYVLIQPQDYLGFYFLADIVSRRFMKSATAEYYFMKSLMLSKSNNLNGNLQVGLKFFRMGRYSRAVEYLSKANDECCFKSKNPSDILQLILNSDTLESKVLNSDEQIKILEKEVEDDAEEDENYGIFNLFNDTSSVVTEKRNPDLKFLKLHYALAYSFICLNEEQQALWYLDICNEIDQKNESFKLCKLLIDSNVPQKERIREMLELSSSISKFKSSQIDQLPPKIKEIFNCFSNKPFHSGRCVGYCFLLEGLSSGEFTSYERSLKEDSQNVLFQLIVAKQMAKSGSISQAIQRFSQIIKSSAYHPTIDAQAELAEIYFGTKTYEQSLYNYEKVFLARKNNLKILLKIGQVQFRLKQYKHSLTTLSKMDTFDEIPKKLQESLYYQRAKSHWKCEEYKEGLGFLQRIENITQQKVVYLEGVLHYELKNFKTAIEKFHLSKGNTTIKNNHSYYMLGQIALATSEPIKKTIEFFEMELKSNPSYQPAVQVLGKTHYDLGNLQESFNVLYSLKFEELTDDSLLKLIEVICKKLRLFSELSKIYELWQFNFPEAKIQTSIKLAKNLQFQQHSYEKAITQYEIHDILRSNPDVQFQIAKCLIEIGQSERALIILSKLLEGDQQIHYLLTIASIYLDSGEYSLAGDFAKRGLLINPMHTSGLLILAYIHLYGDRKYKEAIRIYKKCLLQDDQNPMVFFYLGVAYRKLKKIRKAEICFELSVRINPTLECAKLFLGFIQFSEGKMEKAYENLKSITKPPMKEIKYYYCLARLKEGEGSIKSETTLNYEQSLLFGFNFKYFSGSIQQVLDESTSINEFNHWIKIMKDYLESESKDVALVPDLNKYLGMAKVSIRNNFKVAKTHLQSYLNAQPGCEISKIRLARCNFELNEDLNETQKSLNKISNKSKGLIEYQLLQVDVYIKQSKILLASRLSSSWNLATVKPRLLLETKYLIARNHIMDGELQKGIDLLTKNNEYAPSQKLLGDLKLEKGDETSAINCYLESLKLENDYTPTLKQIASIYFKQEKYIEASKLLELFQKKSENLDLEVMSSLAKSYFYLKKYSNSMKYGQLITEKFPDHVGTALILGQSQAMLGRYQAGTQILQKGLKVTPEDDEMWYYLSICQEKLGNDKEAKESLHECVRLDPNSVIYWSDLGDIYLKMKEYDVAKQKYDECLSLQPSNKNSLLKLAQIASEQSGKHSEALAYIEHCLKYHSKDNETIFFKFKLFIILGKTMNIKNMFLSYEEHFKTDPELALRILELFMKTPKQIQLQITENQLENVRLAHLQDKKLMKKLESQKNLRLAQVSFMFKKIKLASDYMKEYLVSSGEGGFDNKLTGDSLLLSAQLAFQKGDHYVAQENYKLAIQEFSVNTKYQMKAVLAYYLADTNSNKGQILIDQLRKNGIQSEMLSIAEGVILCNSVKKITDAAEKKSVLEKAISIFQSCIDTYLNCALASYYMADCYAQLGDTNKAKLAYYSCIAVQNEPADSIFSHPLSEIKKLKLKHKLALIEQEKEKINETIESLASENDLESIIEFAEVLFAKGDKAGTLCYAKKALKLDPENARMYFLLGKNSSNEMAVSYFKRCRFYSPKFPQIDLHIAKAYETCGDIQEALTLYLSQLSYKDSSTFVLEKSILILTQQSKYASAQTLLSNYLKLYPNLTPELYISQAHLYRRQGLLDQSIEKLKESLTIYPNHPDTYISIVSVFEEKRDFADIFAILSEFIKRDAFKSSTNSHFKAKIYNSLGNSAAYLGLYQDSITNYGYALKEEPENKGIQINVALCQLAKGKFEKAKESLIRIIDQNKNEIEPVFYLGVAYSLMEQDSLAIKQYRKCLMNYSLFVPAAINLVILLRKVKNYKEAIAVMLPFQRQSVVQINPMYQLALTYFKAGESNNAIAILMKLIQNYESIAESNSSVVERPIDSFYPMLKRNYPNSNYVISNQQSKNSIPTKESLNLLLSRVYRKQNRIDNELRLLENCLAAEPNNPKYVFTYAVSQSIANKKYSGRDEYRKCTYLDPSRKALYLLALSTELHRKGQYTEEIEMLKDVIKLNPGFEQAHTNLGAVYFKLNELQNSLEEYQKAILMNKTNPDNHFNLGNVYLRMKEIDLAIDSYEKAISLNCNHVLALYNLGIALIILKEYKKSAECFEKCIQIDPYGIEKYSNSLSKLHKLLLTQSN